MNMNSPAHFPRITIEVEGMRHAITMALMQHFEQRDQELQTAVAQACAAFDFQAEINKVTDQIIREELRNAIRAAVVTVLYDKELTARLIEITLEELKVTATSYRSRFGGEL